MILDDSAAKKIIVNKIGNTKNTNTNKLISITASLFDDYSGAGIIDRLVKLQNPSYDKQDLKQQFAEINGFLRTVIGNSTATLDRITSYNVCYTKLLRTGQTPPPVRSTSGQISLICLGVTNSVLAPKAVLMAARAFS